LLPRHALQGANNPPSMAMAGDTSTAIVLAALQKRSQWRRDVWAVVQKPLVTTNHFDVSSRCAASGLCCRSLTGQPSRQSVCRASHL